MIFTLLFIKKTKEIAYVHTASVGTYFFIALLTKISYYMIQQIKLVTLVHLRVIKHNNWLHPEYHSCFICSSDILCATFWIVYIIVYVFYYININYICIPLKMWVAIAIFFHEMFYSAILRKKRWTRRYNYKLH